MTNAKKRRRILFFTRLYYPHIGGVEKHIYKISQQLIKKGFEITVVAEQHGKKLKERENIDGINIFRIPIRTSERNKKFEVWKWMVKNKNLVKGFDIIHIHDVFFWIIPLIFSIDRKRVFITFHGYEGYPVKLKHKILRKISELYCNGSICVGDFIKKWYWANPDIVIYGAAERTKLAPTRVERQHSAVFFGRLDSQTGIKEYYGAFLSLKRRYKDFKLEVIGEGEFGNKMNGVSISPFKSNIAKYVQNNRFVFVSGYLSMLEAMLSKKLVFAVYTDPVKKDYLVKSPFVKYVEVCSSSKEIEKKVKFYIDNPKEESIKVEKAYNWAVNQTWSKVTDEYLKLWKI